MKDEKLTKFIMKVGKKRTYVTGNILLFCTSSLLFFTILRDPSIEILKTLQYVIGLGIAATLSVNVFSMIRTELYYSSHKKKWWDDEDKFMSVIYALYLLAMTACVITIYVLMK